MNILIFVAGLFTLLFSITRITLPFRQWAMISAAALAVFTFLGGFSVVWGILVWSIFVVLAVLLGVRDIRKKLLSNPLLYRIKKVLPPMSETERDAIESGSVWWESELFRGSPDWNRLLNYKKPQLSGEEQAFLDGPVNQLCSMIDDWDITHKRKDLPPDIWQFMKQHRFFGMIIPKQYGGLEFSALAHSEVVMRVSARSISAGVTVMVPNSLGPAELLQHYGTDEQKDYYLPRLADGREIPCFALTGPDAGSDAGSIPDSGIVCMGEFEGNKVLGLRLNWDKRYITLGPVSTVLGLAFKVYDPDGLLGDLGHILASSQVGAIIDKQKIPAYHALPLHNCFEYALSGGDDYQILFSVAADKLEAMNALATEQNLELFEIGVITESGFFMLDQHTTIDLANRRGFDHFAT